MQVVLINALKSLQLAPSAGKYAAVLNHGKIKAWCEAREKIVVGTIKARENIYLVASAGKHVTHVKRGKQNKT